MADREDSYLLQVKIHTDTCTSVEICWAARLEGI